MPTVQEHAQTATEHHQTLQQHHNDLGDLINKFNEAITALGAIIQSLIETHSKVGESVQKAADHSAQLHETAASG